MALHQTGHSGVERARSFNNKVLDLLGRRPEHLHVGVGEVADAVEHEPGRGGSGRREGESGRIVWNNGQWRGGGTE